MIDKQYMRAELKACEELDRLGCKTLGITTNKQNAVRMKNGKLILGKNYQECLKKVEVECEKSKMC